MQNYISVNFLVMKSLLLLGRHIENLGETYRKDILLFLPFSVCTYVYEYRSTCTKVYMWRSECSAGVSSWVYLVYWSIPQT